MTSGPPRQEERTISVVICRVAFVQRVALGFPCFDASGNFVGCYRPEMPMTFVPLGSLLSMPHSGFRADHAAALRTNYEWELGKGTTSAIRVAEFGGLDKVKDFLPTALRGDILADNNW